MKILAIRLKNSPPSLASRKSDFTKRTAVQRRPVRHHPVRPAPARAPRVLDAPVPGPVRPQHAAAAKALRPAARFPMARNELSSNRRTQPAARARLPQLVAPEVGFRRHRRPPLSRPLGNPALPGCKADGAFLQKEPAEPPGPGDPAGLLQQRTRKGVPRTAGAKLGLATSPSSLAPCCWPRANSAPSSRPATTTAAHCWRSTRTPACTSQLSKAAYQRASQRRAKRQATRATPGRLPALGRAGPGPARGGAGIPRPGAYPGATGTATSEGQQQWFTGGAAGSAAILCEHALKANLAEARQAGDALATERETLQWLERLAPVRGLIERLEATRAGTGHSEQQQRALPHRAAAAGAERLQGLQACLQEARERQAQADEPSASGPRRRCARGFPAGSEGAPGAKRWPSDRNSIGTGTSATPSSDAVRQRIWRRAMSRNRRNRRHCAYRCLAALGDARRPTSQLGHQQRRQRALEAPGSPRAENPRPTPGELLERLQANGPPSMQK
ncbi:hypothetical protein ACPA9J_27945 [Pseudomonas aeruginosa]